jgi:hypothetical protein
MLGGRSDISGVKIHSTSHQVNEFEQHPLRVVSLSLTLARFRSDEANFVATDQHVDERELAFHAREQSVLWPEESNHLNAVNFNDGRVT